jgi:hypothetical protein
MRLLISDANNEEIELGSPGLKDLGLQIMEVTG